MNTRNIILDNKAFATPLLLYTVDKLGDKAFEYEPETIADFLKQHNPKVTKAVINRTNAAIGLVTSNLFWYDLPTFCIICRTLNRNAAPDRDEPSLFDIAWGMSEAALIISGDAEEALDTDKHQYQYSESIKKYISTRLVEAGVYDNPMSIPDIPIPKINAIFDDSAQMMSIQERSDATKNLIDYKTNQNMAELLLQISTAGVSLSKQAGEELQTLLKDTEMYR